tara:strand:- start:234 stop:677 length:444 start_codon:yes stop_codon:yes gene_type:complete
VLKKGTPMTENFGYNDHTFSLLLFCLLLLPIAALFLAPLMGGAIFTVLAVLSYLWERLEPRVITERVYVNNSVATVKATKEKVFQHKKKHKKPKELNKNPDFFDSVVAGLCSLGMKKNDAKKVARETYRKNLHFDAESLLKDCISQF